MRKAPRIALIVGVLAALACVLLASMLLLLQSEQEAGEGGALPPTPTQPEASGGAEEPTTLPAPGAPETPTPIAQSTPTPIARQAEFAYPVQMQVNRPARVRFSLYAEGSEPLPQQGAATPVVQVSFPAQPGLKPFVLVKLDHNGVQIVKEPADSTQPLYDTINTWEWQILTAAKQDVVLRPQIHIEYRDESGQTKDSYDVPWAEAYTVPADMVVSEGAIGVTAVWLGDHVLEVVGLIFAVPGFIAAVRVPKRKQLSEGDIRREEV